VEPSVRRLLDELNEEELADANIPDIPAAWTGRIPGDAMAVHRNGADGHHHLGLVPFFLGSTPPTNPVAGDLWVSDTKTIAVFNGAEWVIAGQPLPVTVDGWSMVYWKNSWRAGPALAKYASSGYVVASTSADSTVVINVSSAKYAAAPMLTAINGDKNSHPGITFSATFMAETTKDQVVLRVTTAHNVNLAAGVQIRVNWIASGVTTEQVDWLAANTSRAGDRDELRSDLVRLYGLDNDDLLKIEHDLANRS
jgi:hypothetical protein